MTNAPSSRDTNLAALLVLLVAGAAACGSGTGHPAAGSEQDGPGGEPSTAVLRVEGMT